MGRLFGFSAQKKANRKSTVGFDSDPAAGRILLEELNLAMSELDMAKTTFVPPDQAKKVCGDYMNSISRMLAFMENGIVPPDVVARMDEMRCTHVIPMPPPLPASTAICSRIRVG